MSGDLDFKQQMGGAGLLTAEILYHIPDHPTVLQSFTWQTMDRAPRFPRLAEFLDHWRREIEAMIHSIEVAHTDWVGPREVSLVEGEFKLH